MLELNELNSHRNNSACLNSMMHLVIFIYGMAKINEVIAKEIKQMLKDKISQQKIADKFNVSRSLVLGINVGRLWKHV